MSPQDVVADSVAEMQSPAPAPQEQLPTLADAALTPQSLSLGPAVAPLSVEAGSASGSVSAVGVIGTPAAATKIPELVFVPAPGCLQPRQPGPCNNLSPRWFFDQETSECKDFAFGGCLVRPCT